MASFSRFSSFAAFVSAVSGYAIGEFPTPTVGYGEPFPQEPTKAPSMELLKRNLALGKKALANTCTQWTLEGGGQPECYAGRTCLFYNSAPDGYLYEGCGETSVSYDWITECWPYTAKTGIPPVSQIYCPSTAPDCGFYAFNFGNGNTYYNFGCSTTSYRLYADLISTQGANSAVGQTIVLAAGGTSSITESQGTSTVQISTSIPVLPGGFGGATTTSSPTQTPGGSGSTPTSTGQSIGSHSTKSKAPIGAIVGGVIGGIALIAFLAFLAWFILRKRRQDAARNQAHEAQVQQQQADATTAAAFHSPNRISEIGTTKPMPQSQFAGAFAPAPHAGQENPHGGENEKLMGQQVNEYPSPSPQSPPPMYAHPPAQQTPQQIPLPAAQSPYPPSNYTELDNQNLQPGSARASLQPGSVSPVGTYNSNATELGGNNVGTYQPPASPPNAQPYMPPPQEMSGNAASTMLPRPSGGFDMSGAPMSENYGHHELP